MYATAGVVDFDLRTWESRRWVTWAFRLGVKLADEIIVQTDEQVPLCRERFGREPVLIKSISEPAEPQDPRPEAFVWAGWLREYKRPLAFVELARAVPEAQFWIVGVPVPGEKGQELAAAVARAAEAVPNLTLLAPRPRSELGALIERAVAVVSTSRTEGMPNVFMEGWARGVPALALAHDPDGVLEREALGGCAQGSPDRMAQLARDAWASREGRDEQSARCRAYVAREHSLERVADGWVEALGV
jgi:glycosyltransferase involved in cell wall biosynthesis